MQPTDYPILSDFYELIEAEYKAFIPGLGFKDIYNILARHKVDKTAAEIFCQVDILANTLILGNSGQGKSYLLKLILTNLRESGKNIICLDPEMEYVDLTKNLGGCFRSHRFCRKMKRDKGSRCCLRELPSQTAPETYSDRSALRS